ncbi:MAG TPA: hypothetical protein VD862_00345 [Candidatus Paceibacterota bacterium]|nr:hypothetical protein [Candidatus Paceibacterota bacterium]
MRIAKWIRQTRARLLVTIDRPLSPTTIELDELPWKCTIRGYVKPEGGAPAVYLLNDDNEEQEGVAYGETPEIAYDKAVRSLVGLRANIVDRDRNITRRFPDDIRP